MPHAETMTPLERWLAVLRRQTPDRVPMDYWGTDETTAKLVAATASDDKWQMLDRLHVDYVFTARGQYVGPPIAPDSDVYGISYRDVDYGSGVYREVTGHPLASFQSVEEIERHYTWPNPDWWDYSHLPRQVRPHAHHPIRGGGSEPFLLYNDLRGGEQAMIDLVEHPDMVEYCLGVLFELAYQDTLRIFEALPGQVTLTYVAEDMGSQAGLLFSPAHIRRFLFPGMRRMIDLAHQAGVYVFHHNDGNILRILPELVELGIDLLNPIQWRAGGMERSLLKQRFGQRLVFHGGMDNQFTLPFGTPEQVRQEVRDNLAVLGAGGGYILAPCHNIQPLTPLENIFAMYETGCSEGWL